MTILQVFVNMEPEAASLNQKNDEKDDTPKSLGENLRNDGANEVTSSEGEVRTDDQTNVPISNYDVPGLARHDQKNDAPDCNTDVLKPAAAESAMCLSNQGMK